MQYRYAYTNGQWVLLASQQTYSPRGERLIAYSEGSSTQVGEQCTYDDAGRLLTRRTWFPPGLRMDWIDQEGLLSHVFVGGMLSGDTTYTYDDDGRLLTQTSRERSSTQVERFPAGYPSNPARMLYAWVGEVFDGVPGTADDPLIALRGVNTVDYTGRYDSAGRVTGYTVQNTDTAAHYTHTYTLAYTGWDDYREASISGSSDNSAYKATTTTLTYDPAGRQTELREHTDALDDRVRSLAFDGDGHVLARRDGTLHNGVFTQSGSTPEALGRQSLHVVYASGQQLATLDEAGRLDAISRLTAFNNSGTGDRQVVVQAGESLRSLAQRLYGTEALWYVLAEANGLDETDTLIAGTSLTAPEVTTVSNDATTFKPYDPSEITGPTAPALPYITAPSAAGCSPVMMILAVVVMIVVAIFAPMLAPAMSQAFGGAVVATGAYAGSTIGGVIAANFVVAAGASAVTQGIGSALGETTFSWRQVAVDGITAAVSAGSAQMLTGAGSAAASGSTYSTVTTGVDRVRQLNTLGRVYQGLAYYGGSVMANAVVGRDPQFSWSAVAASVVGSYASAKLGGSLPLNQGGSAAGMFDSFLNNSVQATSRRLFGLGKQDWAQIAADAFGNALGNAAVRGIGDWQAGRAGSQSGDLMQSWAAEDEQQRQQMIATEEQSRPGYWMGNQSGVAGLPTNVTKLDDIVLADDGRDGDYGVVRTFPVRDNPPVIVEPLPEETYPRTWISRVNGGGYDPRYSNGASDAGGAAYYAGRFLHGAASVVTEPVLMTADLFRMGYSVAATEYTGQLHEIKMWSTMGKAGESGATTWDLLPRALPVVNVGMFSYDMTTAALNGDWGSVAEGAGGVAGGFAFAKYGQRYLAPQAGAELGVIRVRTSGDLPSPIPGLADLPGREVVNFEGMPAPTQIGDAPAYRIFDTLDNPKPGDSPPNGSYWSSGRYESEAAWRSGAAVQKDWNAGLYEGTWLPEPQPVWGGLAAPQGIRGSSFESWGFRFGWIHRGGDFQFYVPNARSAIQPSQIVVKPAPWRGP